MTINKPVPIILTAAILMAISPGYVMAQHQHNNSSYHKEMSATMEKMDRDMKAAPMSGDPDIDFAEMMIPHHQGAVDMAKVQLKYGKDEKLRALAESIIQSQEKEIKEMKERIAELKKTTTTTTTSTMSHHH